MVLAISKMKLDFQIDNWTSKLSIRKAKVLIIRSVHSTKVLVVVPTKVGPILFYLVYFDHEHIFFERTLTRNVILF